MSTPADILNIIAPEFKDIDYTGALQVADMQISPGLCADKRPLLVAYLAAHILTIANPTGTSVGNISSITQGQVSVRYENIKSSITSTGLANTKYGQEYDRLRRGCIMTVRTRVNDIIFSNGLYPYGINNIDYNGRYGKL